MWNLSILVSDVLLRQMIITEMMKLPLGQGKGGKRIRQGKKLNRKMGLHIYKSIGQSEKKTVAVIYNLFIIY